VLQKLNLTQQKQTTKNKIIQAKTENTQNAKHKQTQETKPQHKTNTEL